MIKRHRDRDNRQRQRRRRAARQPFARPIAAAYAEERTTREETAREIRQTLALVEALQNRPDVEQAAVPAADPRTVPIAVAPAGPLPASHAALHASTAAPIEPVVFASPRLPEIVPITTDLPSERTAVSAPPVAVAQRFAAQPVAAQAVVEPICAAVPEPHLADVIAPREPSVPVGSTPPAAADALHDGVLLWWWRTLFWPVVLAALIIVASNMLTPSVRPGAHLRPAPIATAPAPVGDAVTAVAVDPRLSTAPVATTADPVAVLALPATLPASDAVDGAVAAREVDFLPRTRACSTGEIANVASAGHVPPPEAFGVALAAAAEAQLRDFVIYNDEYFNLRYPGGDVPALYGVCSDVVIRAYRALGIDLQKAVHEARVGSGDSSIDHRRTETLRKFFARHATRLPVTDYAEDYLAGDIVSYERPQNHGAQAHIAIVSTEFGASGRPMIVHNRGWGPQIEDALFVDRITGHYRLSGSPRLLTSWSKGNGLGRGMESWSTLVRRAAIQRGASPNPKETAKKKGS